MRSYSIACQSLGFLRKQGEIFSVLWRQMYCKEFKEFLMIDFRADGRKRVECNRIEMQCNIMETVFAMIAETRPARERLPPPQFCTALGFMNANRISIFDGYGKFSTSRLSTIGIQNNSLLSYIHLEFKISHANATELKSEADYVKQYTFSYSLL